jgi:hypothetical protein
MAHPKRCDSSTLCRKRRKLPLPFTVADVADNINNNNSNNNNNNNNKSILDFKTILHSRKSDNVKKSAWTAPSYASGGREQLHIV